MGKRGPKPGNGGRPILYGDEFHRIQREKMRLYREALRKVQAEQDNSQFQVMRPRWK